MFVTPIPVDAALAQLAMRPYCLIVAATPRRCDNMPHMLPPNMAAEA
jgi:hypothetical protein